MNSNMKRNRGGRMNTGGRNDKRTSYQERQGGMRRATPEKNTPITLDGVYKNTRYTHVIYSLVGSNVQVQVKNGVVYEGVLKTFSPKGDVVLEMAHMVDDNCNSSNSVSSAPSRDRLMDKLIVKPGDVIMVNVTNVDLDYAVKDSFTDAGISKYNGEVSEKNMKELEPWVGEGEIEVSGLESERSNGWDPNDMFRCNAENFNVTSSYDDSLEQYTTKLEKKDTEEYKRREEAASKLAAEIEDTAQYKKNIALENGEGDLDEETRFSAVIRTSEANNQSAPFVQSSGGPGKYVPPNRRPGSNPVVNRPARGAYHQSMGRNPPGHPIIPPTSQQQSPQPPPPQPMSSPHQQQQAPHPSSQQQQHGQSSVQKPPRLEALNVNGEEPAPVPTSTASPTVKVASPVSEQPSSKTGENKPDTSHNPTSPGSNKPLGNRETGREDRGKQIEAFKQFSDTIKLDQKKEKEKSIEDSKEQDNTIEKEKRLEAPQKTEEPHSQESPQKTVQEPQSPQKMDPQPSDANRQSEEQKKSTLNPYAQEFVPKPSQPKQAPLPQVPTPPHPQTQSPLAIPQQPIMNIPQPQMIAAGPGGQLYMQQPNMLFNVQTQQTQRKRAVVSVKPDNTAAAVQAAQAAQAATGQPLLAAQSAPQNYVYMPQMVPQPQGYHPQMGQVMRMPPAANPTFMTPQTASVPGMPPTSHPGTVEPSNQTHTGQTGPTMYMQNPQGGPMPAHMSHTQPAQFSHQTHISHQMSNPQTPQSSQMNPASHHPPAPSPVHTTGPNPQQPINQGQPPSSGTPQPPQGYQQALQPHPPLQPSPHNQTSPQNIPPLHYPYTSLSHMQMPSGMTPHSSVPSSVTYNSMQTQGHHSPLMPQPQIVMMPPPNPAGMQHPHIQSTQFQAHHPMAGPGSVHGQTQMIPQGSMGVQGLTGANSQGAHHPSQMQQYLPQGLTAAAALTNAIHARSDHFIVQHVRK